VQIMHGEHEDEAADLMLGRHAAAIPRARMVPLPPSAPRTAAWPSPSSKRPRQPAVDFEVIAAMGAAAQPIPQVTQAVFRRRPRKPVRRNTVVPWRRAPPEQSKKVRSVPGLACVGGTNR